MHILFLYPVPKPDRKVYTGFSHGIGSLSAVLKARGHDTSLLIVFEPDEAELGRAISAHDPGLVAISCASPQAVLAGRLAATARALTDVPIVLGGPHAGADPEGALDLDGVDGICVGEGETALVELVDAIERGEDFSGTPNFRFRRDGEIVTNPPAPRADLDALPHPDRELFPYARILASHRDLVGAEFLASRGCPHACRHCGNERLSSPYGGPGRYYRTRSVEGLLDEIATVRRRWDDVRLVGFHDDIFGLEPRWLDAFADRYPREVGLPFWCNQRPERLDTGRAEALRRAGCTRVHIGLESGSDRIRTEQLGRAIGRERIVEAFRCARAAGLRTVAFNMIGLPGESEADLLETIRLNREIRPDWIILSVYAPLPGTPLGDACLEQGWTPAEPWESYYDPDGVIRHPDVDADRVRYYHRNFVSLVYRGRPGGGSD